MTMRDRQIRRLVVTEDYNTKVVGVISLGDISGTRMCHDKRERR